MSTAKLVALLLISFLATASIVYRLRNRRSPVSSVVTAVPGSVTLPANDGPGPAAAPAPVAVPQPEANTPKLDIPANGWGRNPFLTIDEINRLNQPEMQVIAETPVQRPTEPAGLPSYEVTAIISGSQGAWAVVGNRLVQVGYRLGVETVKEIKERAVVLEHEGRTRELPLRRLEDVQAPAPKKETKQ